MYIRREEKIEFPEQYSGKILICQKDIKCHNGVFTKGTLVYPIFDVCDDGMALFEVPKIEDMCESILDSNFDYTEETIDTENCNEYFMISKEATAYYDKINTEKETLYEKGEKFDVFAKWLAIGAFSLLFILLIDLSIEMIERIEGRNTLIIFGGACFLLMTLACIFYHISYHIYSKATNTFSKRMKDLTVIALESE